LDRKVGSSVRKALVKLFSERPVCRAEKLHLVPIKHFLHPEGGLVAKASKPFVGIPVGKPPPILGTFGPAGKVWVKA